MTICSYDHKHQASCHKQRTKWIRSKVNLQRENKGSPNKKKLFVTIYGCSFYMILIYVMLTIIDPKIIELGLLVFELCPFLQKYPKIKFSNGSLHSKQIITATVIVSLIHCKSHLNTYPLN